jgi:hypothetical protein
MAEEVVTAMILRTMDQNVDVLRGGKEAYSCASKTSPVRLEKPRKGEIGSETLVTRKHGVHSSHALYWIETSIYSSLRYVTLSFVATLVLRTLACA